MNAIGRYAQDFFSLFFPELCSGCGKNLFKNEDAICLDCIYNLPYTNFHKHADNRVARQLYGRIPFQFSSAFVYFQKGSRVQSLMHNLKYNNKPEVAFRLGEMYGIELQDTAAHHNLHTIIPVPLHPARQKKRGYNQSEYFANGLSQSLKIPVSTNLKRSVFTDTQTKKTRFVRYENMKDVFSVEKEALLENHHILLVDDVVTTGATLEACANRLLKIKGVQISIASIAFTS